MAQQSGFGPVQPLVDDMSKMLSKVNSVLSYGPMKYVKVPQRKTDSPYLDKRVAAANESFRKLAEQERAKAAKKRPISKPAGNSARSTGKGKAQRKITTTKRLGR